MVTDTGSPLTAPPAGEAAASRPDPGRRGHIRHPIVRLWGQSKGVRLRLAGAAMVGGLASGCAVALMATSAWLIVSASISAGSTSVS